MRQLNIHNLRISIDARDNDAVEEAHSVLAAINNAIDKCDGSPVVIIEGDRVVAEYETINDE